MPIHINQLLPMAQAAAIIRQSRVTLLAYISESIMPRYETHTAQFGLVNGIRQPISDLIMIAEPGSLFAPESRKGHLYIVLETTHDHARSLAACRLVAQTMRKVFYADSPFSVTTALRVAIREANKLLYHQNIKVDSNQRAYVGLTCVVLKGMDLFIAQVAPAQVYVKTENALRAMPTPPSWNTAHLSATPFSKSNAIGSSLFIEPELYRCLLQTGDALAICSSAFTPILSQKDIEQLLHGQNISSATDILYDLCRQYTVSEAHAVIITLTPLLSSTAQSAPLSPTGLSEHGRLVFRVIGDWLARLTGEFTLLVRKKHPHASKYRRDTVPTDAVHPSTPRLQQPSSLVNPLPKALPLDLGESLEQRTQRKARTKSAYKEQRDQHSKEAGDHASSNQPLKSQPRIDLSDMPHLIVNAQPYRPRREIRPLVDLTWGERLALLFQYIMEMLKDVPRHARLRAITPPSTPLVRPQGLSYRRQKPPFPWLFLTLISVLIAGLVLYGIYFSQRNAQQQALNSLDHAEQQIGLVREAATDAEAQEQLEAARRAIDEIQTSAHITETNPVLWVRYQALQRTFERLQSSIQRLNFFNEATILTSHPLPDGRFANIVLPQITTQVTNTGALEASQYFYMLDSMGENSQLYRVRRDGGAPEPYLRPNDEVQNVLVGELIGQAWRVDNIIAIDRGNNGFGYYFRNGNIWNYSRLGGTEQWVSRGRIDVESYDGNLYLWGVQPGEILKFNSGQYTNPPIPWIDPNSLDGRNLSNAIDMVVDFNIYLLQSNGHIWVFSAGRFIQEIVPENITPPISTVTRLVVTGETDDEGWFFLLDTLHERIIQMEKGSGKIIQQIQVRVDSAIRLNELTDMVVDDSGNQTILYLINGGAVIQAILPDPPGLLISPTPESTTTP